MLAALGWFAVRRRRWVVAGTLAAVVVAGALGGGVFGRLSGGGFSDPDAESSRARDQLERVFGAGDPNLVLLVTAEQGSVDDPAVTAEGTALREELVSEPSSSRRPPTGRSGGRFRCAATTGARRWCWPESPGTRTRSIKPSRSCCPATRAPRPGNGRRRRPGGGVPPDQRPAPTVVAAQRFNHSPITDR